MSDASASLPEDVLYSGRFVRLVRRGPWEYVDRPNATGAVGLIAVTPAGELLLVEQFRIPLGRRVIEIPAGIVGDEADVAHDDVLTAARRELLEETGYEAERFTVVAEGPTSAGLSTEVVTFVHAQGLRRVRAGGGVDHEQIVVHQPPLATIDAWLAQQSAAGRAIDPKIYAALYLLRGRTAAEPAGD